MHRIVSALGGTGIPVLNLTWSQSCGFGIDKARACVRQLLAFNSARGLSTAPAAPLFQNRCHGPLSVRSIQQLVAGYREKAGLDVRATPHTLRHSSASHMVAAGVPTVYVQQVLGHRYLSRVDPICRSPSKRLTDFSILQDFCLVCLLIFHGGPVAQG